jgi:hypothetical protein
VARLMTGFGFNLENDGITMWVGGCRSNPLSDDQLDDVVRTVEEFRKLRDTPSGGTCKS